MTQIRTSRCASRRPAMLVSLAVAAGLALSACGGGDNQASGPTGTGTSPAAPKAPATVDATKVEAALKRSFKGISLPAVPTMIYPKGGGPPQQSQIGGGRLKVRSVTCPEDIPARTGGKFSCDIDAGKTSATVQLTQLNSTGTKLRFRATFKSEMTAGVTGTTRLNGQIKVTP